MINYLFRFVKAIGLVFKAIQCVYSVLSVRSSLVTLMLSWLHNVVTHFTTLASHNGLGNTFNTVFLLISLTSFSLNVQYQEILSNLSSNHV